MHRDFRSSDSLVLQLKWDKTAGVQKKAPEFPAV